MRKRLGPFVAVGALGFVIQMATFAVLTTLLHWQYGLAVAFAVEVAIVHNFWWHERWTWRDRSTSAGALTRLLRFHMGTGCISMVGNLAGTAYMVEHFHVGPLAGNIGAITCTGVVNFAVGDRWVFPVQSRPPSVLPEA